MIPGVRPVQCPKCGYVMGPFDTECERCKRIGEPAQARVPQPLSPEVRERIANAFADDEATPPTEDLTATQARAIRARSVRSLSIGLVLIAVGVISAFVWTERTADAAEHEALEAMLDLDAAVTVGVSYLTYADYVIKAKQQVQQAHDAASSLAQGRTFWTEVEAALDDYEFAAEAWTWEFKEHDSDDYITDQDMCSIIKERYPDFQFGYVPADTVYQTALPAYWFADIDSVRQVAWASADAHMTRAQALSR